jgi:hypothetical protein
MILTPEEEREIETRIKIVRKSIDSLENFLMSEYSDEVLISIRKKLGEEESHLLDLKRKYPEFFI